MGERRKNYREIGAEYEQRATLFLEKQGCRIRTRNYRCRAGEIDLVAWDGDVLVFCEVKYRKTRQKGEPLEAVTAGKRRTLSRCALFYLMEKGWEDIPCRFDVIGIYGEENEITYIRNAFDYEE